MSARIFALMLLATAVCAGQSKPAGPPPGTLIDIGGHKLHLHCAGPVSDARPTVILEAGGGAYSTSWAAVQNRLSDRLRVCAYDRAGSGWSEPGPRPRTMHQEVFELNALLPAAGIRGAIVLVGHSLGGLLVRLYTEKYGENAKGAVLVDATHEDTVLFNTKLNRFIRMRELATAREIPKPRRDKSVPDESGVDYFAEEMRLFHLSRQTTPHTFGSRPLIVLGAGKRPAPPGMTEDVWKDLQKEKYAQARELAELSSNSRFVLAEKSGHQIPTEDPALVASAIEEVVNAASKGERLQP